MASKLSMISGAAIRLGADPVIALTEGSKAAVAGGNLYDTILHATLAAHRWRFAVGQIALSKLTDSPLETSKWQYAYQLPTNPAVLTIIRVFPRQDYERYEDKIYVNSSSGISIDYVYKPAENTFPPYFVELMELRLAEALAVPITGSRTLKEQFTVDVIGNTYLPGALAHAMASDSRERPPQEIVDSPFIEVRR